MAEQGSGDDFIEDEDFSRLMEEAQTNVHTLRQDFAPKKLKSKSVKKRGPPRRYSSYLFYHLPISCPLPKTSTKELREKCPIFQRHKRDGYGRH